MAKDPHENLYSSNVQTMGGKDDVALKSKFLRLLLTCKLLSRHVEEAAQSVRSSNNEMKCCACEACHYGRGL